MDINQKVVVITGGGRGLGAAMAKRLAAVGAKLALVDMDADALSATAAECKEAGAAAVATYTVNVAMEEEVDTLFQKISDDLGAPHALVNNAGITRDALLLKYRDGEQVSKMTMEQWQAVIDVNLTGVFLCAREAAAAMIEAGNAGPDAPARTTGAASRGCAATTTAAAST